MLLPCRLLLLRLALLWAPLFTAAQVVRGEGLAPQKPQVSETVRGLGTAAFRTSTGSAEAQTAFIRGLLLLHLFEYYDAAQAFLAAEKLDPAFAMAYWGEAMTYNHGVWNQVDAEGGNKALKKLGATGEDRAARVVDPRERGLLAAVGLLFERTGDKVQRDHRYAKAMEQMSAAYPSDDEIRLFYALALLGQSEGVRDVPVYLQAANIAKAVFAREPDNPGAAHYWIHGMDDPDHAAGALVAARALSRIAPDAAHAQHMCSHIFMALGLWDDVVQANVEAMRVTDSQDEANGFPPRHCGHYDEWLQYGYFQQGRYRDAARTLAACQASDTAIATWAQAHPGMQPFHRDAARVHSMMEGSKVRMRGTGVIESREWKGPATEMTLDKSVLDVEETGWNEFVSGYAKAERGELAPARGHLEALRRATKQYSGRADADKETAAALEVGAGELSGLIRSKEHDYDGAISELRQASGRYQSMAYAFGPPVTIKPPEELLGEVLLERGDFGSARDAFKLALARAPKRTQSLLGLARAQQGAGDHASASTSYRELLSIWHGADPNAADLEEARRFQARGATHAARLK